MTWYRWRDDLCEWMGLATCDELQAGGPVESVTENSSLSRIRDRKLEYVMHQ